MRPCWPGGAREWRHESVPRRRQSCCAPRSWVRRTGSSRCSPAATAGSGRWPRACGRRSPSSGARLEPFIARRRAVVRRAIGRWTSCTQSETIAPLRRRRSSPTTPATPPARPCWRPPSGSPTTRASPPCSSILLLVGGLRDAGRGQHEPAAGARRLPAALAGRQRLCAELHRLRPVRRARAEPGLLGRDGRIGVPAVPPGGRGGSARGGPRAAGRAADRGLGDRGRQRAPASPGGQRAGRRLPALAPGARCARCGLWSADEEDRAVPVRRQRGVEGRTADAWFPAAAARVRSRRLRTRPARGRRRSRWSSSPSTWRS